MSEATVKALTDLIYDRIVDLAAVDGLNNEQIHNIAHAAAQTIESAGTRLPAQKRVGSWDPATERFSFNLNLSELPQPVWVDLP
jgi:hypothetical protein